MTSLVVTGTMAGICVLATVTAALHRSYQVTVVEAGVATAQEVVDQISGW